MSWSETDRQTGPCLLAYLTGGTLTGRTAVGVRWEMRRGGLATSVAMDGQRWKSRRIVSSKFVVMGRGEVLLGRAVNLGGNGWTTLEFPRSCPSKCDRDTTRSITRKGCQPRWQSSSSLNSPRLGWPGPSQHHSTHTPPTRIIFPARHCMSTVKNKVGCCR